MSRSIILLGGPDSGKTNYIGRLWRALDVGAGALHAAEQPGDIHVPIGDENRRQTAPRIENVKPAVHTMYSFACSGHCPASPVDVQAAAADEGRASHRLPSACPGSSTKR